jgi:hypothetical protein
MERKEDIILECFVAKGSRADFLGMIYLERGEDLRGLIRLRFLDNRIFLKFLAGEDRKILSERLLKEADDWTEEGRVPSVHWTYPGGIKESVFIHTLREAQKDWEVRKKRAEN